MWLALLGLPWWLTCRVRRCRFNPWVRKIHWKRNSQGFPVFFWKMPWNQRSLVGYSPWSYRKVRQVLATKQQQQKAPLSQRYIIFFIYCSIQFANILLKLLLLLLFSHPVMSYSLQHHGLQQARTPCPSSSSRVFPSLCSLHQWCCPTISPSDTLLSICAQFLQHQGLFQWVVCLLLMTKILGLQH